MGYDPDLDGVFARLDDPRFDALAQRLTTLEGSTALATILADMEAIRARLAALEAGQTPEEPEEPPVEPKEPEEPEEPEEPQEPPVANILSLFRKPGDFSTTHLRENKYPTGPHTLTDPALIERHADGTATIHGEQRLNQVVNGRSYYTGSLVTREPLHFAKGLFGGLVHLKGRAVGALFSYGSSGKEIDFEATYLLGEAAWSPNLWMPKQGGNRYSAGVTSPRIFRRAPVTDRPQALLARLTDDGCEFYHQTFNADLTPAGPLVLFETITRADFPADVIWDTSTADQAIFTTIEWHGKWAGWGAEDYAQPASMRVYGITPGALTASLDAQAIGDTPETLDPAARTLDGIAWAFATTGGGRAGFLPDGKTIGLARAADGTGSNSAKTTFPTQPGKLHRFHFSTRGQVSVTGAGATWAGMGSGNHVREWTPAGTSETVTFVSNFATLHYVGAVRLEVVEPEAPEEPEEPPVEPEEPPVEPEPPAPATVKSPLAYNLAGVTAEGTNFPFLNIAKLNRGFQAGWGADQSHDALQRAGHLDADGYPIRIPPGADKVEGVWDMGYEPARSSRAGRYVLRYDGDGDIYVGLSGTVVSRQPGRIVFDFRADGAMTIGMTRIAAGNHPRNWRICKEDEVAALDAGAVFRPEWMAIVGKAGVLRFMDWLHVNFPKYSTWAERPKVSDATYTRKGVPLELIARLANEARIAPWINLPHTVTDDFITRAARLFAETLDPAKVPEVRLARSNEDWNALFPVVGWDGDRVAQQWGGDRNRWFEWSIKEAVRFARVWQAGWDSVAKPKPRLIHVREVHIGNSWLAEEQFKASLWRQREPDTFVDPRGVFDEIAVATYFGVGVMLNSSTRTELLRRVRENPAAASVWLRDMMLGAENDGVLRLAHHFRYMKEAIGRIQPAGKKIRMVAYEGGTHIQHSFGGGIPAEDENALAAFLSDFSYSAHMGELYTAWADLWQQWGEGPFMEFNDVQEPTKWGSWAPRRHLRDTNPRQGVVDGLSARPVWWS